MADKRDILIRLLGEETVSRMAGKAGDGLDKFGGKLDATERDAHDLDRAIADVEGDLRTLAVAFARTTDAADRVDITRAIRKQKGELRKLTSAKDLLGDIEKAGEEIGGGLLGGIAKVLPGGLGEAFSALPPQVQSGVAVAGAAIGVTLAGAVGAALTAGLLLAVGGGVLAAGIAAAAKSPKVQEAWKSFGERAKSVFAEFGKPFEGPVARALGTFSGRLKKLEPTFKRMGESMAPLIDKLAPALADLAENSLPGIEKAMEASKPLWDTLAEHAPKIGDAISRFFDSIADGGPGANKFLGDFLTLVESQITMLGKVIGTLATLYGKAREVWIGVGKIFVAGIKVILTAIGKIVGAAATAFGWIPGLGPKLKTAAAKFEEFRKKANAELDKITDEKVTVTIVTRHNDDGSVSAHHSSGGGGRTGGQEHRASGGPVRAGQPYLVGEEGPELITPTRDGWVHDAAATARMRASAMSGASMGAAAAPAATVIELRSGGSRLDDLLVEILRRAISDRGGNVQAVLGR